MRHHRKLTDDERHQIIEAREKGTPVATLASCFNVSPRTIYNTLNRAQGSGPTPTCNRTVSTRVSDRDLTGFMAALAKRGITDRTAAMRRLMDVADQLLKPADQATNDKLQGWGTEIRTHGAAINHIARKLNEAKLLRQPIPYTADDDAHIRAMMLFIFRFVEELNALWSAELEAKSREIGKALAGLEVWKVAVQ